MNRVIENLPFITTAAEYFDRQTGAAWRLRNAFFNPLVWSAYRLDQLKKEGGAPEAISEQHVKASTLRALLHNAAEDGFSFNLLPDAVAGALGLNREQAPGVEALNLAKAKCLRARSAARFAEYHNAALDALEEKRAAKAHSCSAISDFISNVDHDAPYDEGAIESELDKIIEVIGHVTLQLKAECDAQLLSAITAERINRLEAFSAGIEQMLKTLDIDLVKVESNEAKLKADVAKEMAKIDAANAKIKEQVDAAYAAQNSKPKLTRIKAA